MVARTCSNWPARPLPIPSTTALIPPLSYCLLADILRKRTRMLGGLPVYLAFLDGPMLASSLFKEKRLMTQVLAISAAIVAVMTILAFGEPTIQRTMGDGAQAQHSTKVRDQACYRRCRNDMRKSTSACNRLCR
jgi:hypothetical protein